MINPEVIAQLCAKKVSGVLATVIGTDGLGPAQKGDHLFWSEGKLLAGTVGGGENEEQVIRACAALDEHQKIIDVAPIFSGVGSSCGGSLQVRLQQLDLTREEDITLLKNLQCKPESGRLLLCGAGHVVRELVWLADRTGFHSVIVDPRAELLQGNELPATASRIYSSASDWLAGASVRTTDYIIIAGPDHATDLAVLQQAAKTAAHYIGVMGSSRKINAFTTSLQQQGLDPTLDGRLYAPIGLDIPSKRPAEVAVSIVGQLIAVRADLSLK